MTKTTFIFSHYRKSTYKVLHYSVKISNLILNEMWKCNLQVSIICINSIDKFNLLIIIHQYRYLDETIDDICRKMKIIKVKTYI